MLKPKSPTAVVLGSVHMDLIASADRLPGRGESIAGGSFSMSPGGKCGNQACQLALAGTPTYVLTRLGKDIFGEQLLDALVAKGVDISHVRFDEEAGTGVSCVLSAEGDYSSIIASGAAANLSVEDIERASIVIESAGALLLQLELAVELSTRAARMAHRRARFIVLNASPAPGEFSLLPKDLQASVSVLIVNGVEARRLLGRQDNPHYAAELAQRFNIETVVVTAGATGSIAVRGKEFIHQPAFPVTVVDSVGAGDAFLGTFVTALLEDAPLKHAMQRGAAAGAIAVSRHGGHDGLPSRDDVDEFLKGVEKS